ncbi:leucine-rich repeat domain-containing protein [Belliella kenyensis]|uniref:Leucine-rich repeat domain-containing protein n=1 Tax=Belliella kenyensis TaxID=1472724 RepID=A0ABV8EN18_9BACT|nr:leucine-rich repeat domain-containing protein [Belliella kenyensis]MCH7403242.1 leucine-rich repeat domain-containing protein [Belliella kenyensis]MDN3604853.1 leucine-rich repeat domain-containing protein [Belliella kenyensis]
MTRNKIPFILIALMFVNSLVTKAQQAIGDYSKQEIKDLSQKVEDQVTFLEYFFNTVGSKDTPARDKDVIIRESYKKIFRDHLVQVEDDLLLDRKVITNKDITAYLKDIEFFFKDASFKFKVREVKPFLRDNGELSFLVSMDRTLNATGLNKEKITNTRQRFVEVNVDKKSNELKIASIYTTKLSRDEELKEWWGRLSYTWESYFRSKIGVSEQDSITLDHLYKISNIDSINLAGNQFVMDLEPIEALREIRHIDISNTQIEELNPISNVTFLTSLNISNTPTRDIQFIKYSDRLTHLDISNTQIEDISELGNLKALSFLKAQNTPIMSFGVLNSFSALRELDLKASGFNNLENVQELSDLKSLDISSNYLINFEVLSNLESLEFINLKETNIVDLTPLKALKKLNTVNIDQTEISDINALDGLPALKRIYADRTRIEEWVADEFIRRNKNILLIHHVENLHTWWGGLSQPWRTVFEKINPRLSRPNINAEDLSTLVAMDSLDISGSEVLNLGPVLKFKKINFLAFDDTEITDLSPLSDIKTLVKISGKNTPVSSLQPLTNLPNLENLDFRNSKVVEIGPLTQLKNLNYLNVDNAPLDREDVVPLLTSNPDLTLIYRTDEVEQWWDRLDDTWKDLVKKNFESKSDPNSEDLHVWTSSPKFEIVKISVSSFGNLTDFINLKELKISDVPAMDYSALNELKHLESLTINQAPISDLSVLSNLNNLTYLNLSNTGIADLRPISSLRNLNTLLIPGTNVKNLRGLDQLYELQELDIASTNVKSLKPVQGLTNLDKLICFNTRIKKRAVDNFKKLNPDCDVRFY